MLVSLPLLLHGIATGTYITNRHYCILENALKIGEKIAQMAMYGGLDLGGTKL